MSSDRRIPRRRVRAFPGGRLAFNHREGASEPLDDAWWEDVLFDRRARLPWEGSIDDEENIHAQYRLDKQPGDSLRIECRYCKELRNYSLASLRRDWPGNTNVVRLVKNICPSKATRRDGSCAAKIVR